jgi:hypothetical protein
MEAKSLLMCSQKPATFLIISRMEKFHIFVTNFFKVHVILFFVFLFIIHKECIQGSDKE